MKIVEKQLGDAVLSLEIVDGFVVEQIRYPIAKAAEPAHKFLDKVIDGAEDKIPGDWDKAFLEPARIAGHAAIDKYTKG